jgi:hypothetical protein
MDPEVATFCAVGRTDDNVSHRESRTFLPASWRSFEEKSCGSTETGSGNLNVTSFLLFFETVTK